eukprot:TRINITY_DN168_c1_g1_i1.p1 TRINITY_DN168_c1_g1~~TRINITY_DN168_c1_g1_i1.p1  ORF type:complete len:435 (+),score=99.48 TRINITY_DN168_c1_g1_i1:76-1380(+)
MEALLQAIQSRSKKGDDEHLRKLFDEGVETVLGKHPEYVGMLLANLELGKYSAAWCFILCCGGLKKGEAAKVWLGQVEAFLDGMCGDQIRDVCGDRLAAISAMYAETCRSLKCPGRGVPHLLRGIQKIRKTPNDLTPFHPDYLCLCLIQKQYNQAKDIVSKPILSIDPMATGVTPVHMMLYYYYCAMVHIGLKDFKAAIVCLESCMCTPSTCLTAITLQAYKKYILCCLIEEGKVPGALPKHCPLGVVKLVKKYASVYVDFQALFAGGKVAENGLAEYLKTHEDALKADKNLGLAKQAVASHKKTLVKQVVSTYTTISMADFAQAINVPTTEEAERLLHHLASTCQLNVTIDVKNRMLHFPQREVFTHGSSDILAEIDKLKQLTGTIQGRDEDVQLSREYILKELNKDPAFREQFASHKTKKSLVAAMFKWSFN